MYDDRVIVNVIGALPVHLGMFFLTSVLLVMTTECHSWEYTARVPTCHHRDSSNACRRFAHCGDLLQFLFQHATTSD